MTSEKKIIIIFGKRGKGKTYLARKLVASEGRLLIFDTLCHDYTDGVVFETERWFEFCQFWKQTYRSNFRLIYRPLNPAEEIERIADLVYSLGDMTFLVEEIDCYCTAHEISESFAHIIQRGRHKNITLIGITQRPYGIHRLLTSQAKEIYVFGTNEPRDRDYLSLLLGQEIEVKLDNLREYQYVYWQEGRQALEIGKA